MLEEIIVPRRSTLISRRAIGPILDSIVDAKGNSLRRISLPPLWTVGQARTEPPLRDCFSQNSVIGVPMVA